MVKRSGSGPPVLAEPPASDAEEIKATLVAIWDAVERGDADACARYIHPDFTVCGENDVYPTQGRESEVDSIRRYVERATHMQTEMHQPIVIVRGDVTWIVYHWTDSGVVEGERFASRGKSTRIIVREGGKWLCVHGHYTAHP